MPSLRVPEIVYTTLTHQPPPERAWTEQPGSNGEEWLCVDIVAGLDADGFVSKTALAAQAADEKVSETLHVPPSGSPIQLRYYQKEAVESVFQLWDEGKVAPIIVLPTGCHRAGQRVIMLDGSAKAVEDVRVGDKLLGPDSTPRTVLALCRGIGPMVEVVPTKGDSWVCNDQHVLSVHLSATHSATRAKYPSQLNAATVEHLTVADYETRSKTFKHRAHLYRAGTLTLEAQDQPIDPYFLGLYLGDGSMAVDGQVGVSKPDQEILSACEDQARQWGLHLRTTVRITETGSCPTHWFTGGHRGGQVNPLLDALRGLGLMGISPEQRFIPVTYKLGSIDQRRQLLAGLMDADGSLTNGGYDFVSKSKQLADDLAFVARSLGQAAYVSPCSKGCQNGFVGDYWRVSLSGDFSQLPTRIPRKKADQRRQKKSVLRTGFKTRRTGTSEPFFGFTLDGDHLYLLEDFTITHNSGKTLVAAEIMRWAHESLRYTRPVFVAHRQELLDQTVAKVKIMAPHRTVGLVQAEHNEPDRHITVASIQTLAGKTGDRVKQIIDQGAPSLLIIDEAHHSTSASFQRVIEAFRAANPNLRILGLTATPGRADGTSLDRVFDCVAYQKSIYEMINEGFLVPPVGVRVILDINLDVVDSESGDFVTKKLAKIVDQPAVNSEIVKQWLVHGQDRKTIAFCITKQHAANIAEEFGKIGIPAAVISEGTKSTQRKQLFQKFREGHIKVLCSVEVLTEGFDEPSVECVLLARPTQSQSLHMQCLDAKTEILTKRGWVGPDTVRDDDIVATMDEKTERTVWSPILSRVDRPLHSRERMFALTLPGLDIRVTGNHRMLYKQRRNKAPIWTVAAQMPKCFSVIVSSKDAEGAVECTDVSDADLTLLGWWYAEGSITKTRGITIYQSTTSPFVDDIEAAINACGIKFGKGRRIYKTEFKDNNDMTHWTMSYGAPRGRDKHKRGWKYLDGWIQTDGTKNPTSAFARLSGRQLLVFLAAFNKGDGRKYSGPAYTWRSHTWSIYQKPGTGFHDLIQSMCVVRGIRCNVAEHSNVPGDWGRLYISPGKRYHTINGTRPELTMREVPATPGERVWCVETSTGTIITRRNGKAAVVGNCIGRGLRLYPGKENCVVIDCTGNSSKHALAQLANLSGLEPPKPPGQGPPLPPDDGVEEQTGEARVDGVFAHALDFKLRKRESKYVWREIPACGWALQIPKIGYFLVAWHSGDRSLATVRFHDMRDGRRDTKPIDVMATPVDFEMAYGLVEAEVQRLLEAKSSRARLKDVEEKDAAPEAFAFLEDGLEDDLYLAETTLRNDANWRTRAITPKQREFLLKKGIKPEKMPETGGEAADLITIMVVESDMKGREPATPKQLYYLRMNSIPYEKGSLTKNAAKKLILNHRMGSKS